MTDIAKRLEGGAVLEVPERALDAMSEDEDAAHLSGDVPVQDYDHVLARWSAFASLLV